MRADRRDPLEAFDAHRFRDHTHEPPAPGAIDENGLKRPDPRVNAVRELYRKFLNLARNTKERRGLRLMQEWLSPAQCQQFDRFGYFDVIGCNSGTLYRIYHSVTAPNVYEINEVGRRQKAVCFAPIGPLVKGDVMLAQRIALETDQQSVLAVANIFAA